MKVLNKVKMAVAAGIVVVASAVGVNLTYAAGGTCPPNSVNSRYEHSVAECNVEKVTQGQDDLMTTLKNIINVIIGIVGFLAVVMIILGGISYTTSAGDASKVKKAKDTIMYGIIGLVIAILAFAIVNFVLSNLFATA